MSGFLCLVLMHVIISNLYLHQKIFSVKNMLEKRKYKGEKYFLFQGQHTVCILVKQLVRLHSHCWLQSLGFQGYFWGFILYVYIPKKAQILK